MIIYAQQFYILILNRSDVTELIWCLINFNIFIFIQVKYSAKYSLDSVITNDVGQNNSVVLASLNPFTLYVINISAFTSKGEGSRGSVELLTDEGCEYTLSFSWIAQRCLELSQPACCSCCHDYITCSNFTTKPHLREIFSNLRCLCELTLFSRGYSFHLCCLRNSFITKFAICINFESKARWSHLLV